MKINDTTTLPIRRDTLPAPTRAEGSNAAASDGATTSAGRGGWCRRVLVRGLALTAGARWLPGARADVPAGQPAERSTFEMSGALSSQFVREATAGHAGASHTGASQAPLYDPSHLRQASRPPGGRQLLEDRPQNPPDLELVVAHSDEHDVLTWIDSMPPEMHVTVYDSSGGMGLWPDRTVTRHTLSEEASVAHTVGRHLALYYDQLAAYTAFVPADAPRHSPWLKYGLADPARLSPVQALGIRTGLTQPPTEFLRTAEAEMTFRAERRSTRTLNSVFYYDLFYLAAQAYRHYYDLSEGDNLIAHHLAQLGLPRWLPGSTDVVSAPHAGMIGVRGSAVHRHPRHIYEQLSAKALESPVIAAVAEQSLLVLFGAYGPPERRGHTRSEAPRNQTSTAITEGATT